MRRTVAVAFWAFVGAVLGFLVGTIAGELAHRAYPDIDEFEYVVAGVLVPFVACSSRRRCWAQSRVWTARTPSA